LTKTIWSAAAERDLLAILDYYAALDDELASRFADSILSETLRLLDFPRMGAPVGARGLRKWQVPGTPFLLLYGVGTSRIEFRRVRHVREDWRRE
jgi:toxin ParE1/3/4